MNGRVPSWLAASLRCAALLAALMGCVFPVVARQSDGSSAALSAIRVLIDSGRYQDGESEARALLSRLEPASLDDQLEVVQAEDLLVAALLGTGKAGQPDTLARAERVVQRKKALVGVDHIEYARSLRNLGDVYEQTWQYPLSIGTYEQALRIAERAGAANLDVAKILDGLARSLYDSERFSDSLQTIRRALAIKERTVPENDTEIAKSLAIEAQILQNDRRLADARRSVMRAQRIHEAVDRESLDSSELIALQGRQLALEGNPSQARPMFERAIMIVEKTIGVDHPRLVQYLRHEAAALQDLGYLQEALAARKRALDIAQRVFGADHPATSGPTNDLAATYYQQGDFTTARSLYEGALATHRRMVSADDSTSAMILYNLALASLGLGDFGEWRRQYDRAMMIYRRVYGPSHPAVGNLESMLARTLSDQALNREASVHYRKALAILEGGFGPMHPDVARTLSRLALALARLGDVQAARPLSTRALDIWERSDLTATRDFADALARHGEIQLAERDATGSIETYRRARQLREQILGPGHPDVAEAHGGLAVALAQGDQRLESLGVALQAESIGRDHLALLLRQLSERQALEYAATRPKGLDLALTIAADAAAVFDAVIRGRGLVIDEMAARQRETTDAQRPDVEPLRAALTAARQRLANLVVRGPAEQPDRYLSLVEEARHEKERAETAFAEKSAPFRDELERRDVGLDRVRAALPAGSALVAFVRYQKALLDPPRMANGQPSAAGRGRSGQFVAVPSYAAFVMRSDREDVAMVRLGSAANIEQLVRNWRHETTGIVLTSAPDDADRTYRAAGNALRERLWQPIATYVKDVSTVFVVPDGTLSLVSLAALPSARGRFLIEDGPTIHYLTAERDLVMPPVPDKTTGGLLALGGAAFDDTIPDHVAAVSSLRGGCGSLQSLHFEPLAGTESEVREVARLWTGSPVEVLQGNRATERAFKREAPGRRVLHLATHGFFLGNDCSGAVAGTRSVGGLVPVASTRTQARLPEDPLLRSGLALAGANRRASVRSNDEDGILTAEEVAALNLTGVEWAVLSACDTGLGEIRAGEGVFGLRRAFQMAGVRTVIMSLWPVGDDSARQWMRALYSGRLRAKLDTASAVRRASLAVLNDRRAKHQSTHPFYWAAFVAAGDWR